MPQFCRTIVDFTASFPGIRDFRRIPGIMAVKIFWGTKKEKETLTDGWDASAFGLILLLLFRRPVIRLRRRRRRDPSSLGVLCTCHAREKISVPGNLEQGGGNQEVSFVTCKCSYMFQSTSSTFALTKASFHAAR